MKKSMVCSQLMAIVFFMTPLNASADAVEQALKAQKAAETAQRIQQIQAATDPLRLCVSRLYYMGDIAAQEAACNCALGNTTEGCGQYKEHIDFYEGIGPQPPAASPPPTMDELTKEAGANLTSEGT